MDLDRPLSEPALFHKFNVVVTKDLRDAIFVRIVVLLTVIGIVPVITRPPSAYRTLTAFER